MSQFSRYRSRNVQVPVCPFCEAEVKRPSRPEGEVAAEFKVGACTCGAIYASDPTGKKQGAVFMDLLVRLAGGRTEVALKLQAGKDYLREVLVDYNERIHQVKIQQVRRRRKILADAGLGVLVFLKRVSGGG